jgi:hypothetical protein
LYLCISFYIAPPCFGPIGPSSGSTYQNLAKVTKITVSLQYQLKHFVKIVVAWRMKGSACGVCSGCGVACDCKNFLWTWLLNTNILPAGGCTYYTGKYNVPTTWRHSAGIGSKCVMGETPNCTDIKFFIDMQQTFISERLLVQPYDGPVRI